MAPVVSFSPGTPGADPAATPGTRLRLGDQLVQSGLLTEEKLQQALDLQRHQDQRLGRILVAEAAITGEDLTEALSRQSGLGRVDLLKSPPDRSILNDVDPYTCLELGAIPWREVGSTRVIALSNPESAERVIETFARPGFRVALALAPPEELQRTIRTAFADTLRSDALTRCPADFSCRDWTVSPNRKRWRLMLAATLALVVLAPLTALQILMTWIMIANAATMGLRLVALFTRARRGRIDPAPVPDATQLGDYRKLPRVSILVPLLREEAVAGRLMEAMRAMDYPPALLDIKLVMEEDDIITRMAIERATLPVTIQPIMVPSDTLKTKPRAMNYALPFCDGEIVGVYDAEDRPDTAQIRDVVRHLQNAPPEVACVQAYLDFYNSDRNWISRCFTLEYAIWFRIILLGVQKLRIPIPLGGTSVFFRRSVLEKIGAWDAHNVTEDADLGMRLARFGYRCEMIHSTTWEEANFRPWPWIKQRSRWLKGYAVTWATHMQRPLALYRDLGPRGFLGFQVLFLGALTSYLSIPLFWLIWTGAVGFDISFWQTIPTWIVWGFFGSMMAGQAVMLTTALIAASDSGRRHLFLWALTLPAYWPLGAIAAYRAIGEVFTRPSYWAKTEHGIKEPAQPARARRRAAWLIRQPGR